MELSLPGYTRTLLKLMISLMRHGENTGRRETKKALEASKTLFVGNTGFEPATPTLSR